MKHAQLSKINLDSTKKKYFTPIYQISVDIYLAIIKLAK